MRILYLTQRFNIKNRGIQTDLLLALSETGHKITIVTCESKEKITNNRVENTEYFKIVYVPVENQFGVSTLMKGLVHIMIPFKMRYSIKKWISSFDFDLILYATPPITFAPVVRYCKKIYKCKTFLALKDIFPQNAVDLGFISKKGIIYWIFRYIEKQLYKSSDYIGCMSEANIKYISSNNPKLNKEKLILFPNTIRKYEVAKEFSREVFLDSIGIPHHKIIFLFGGNLGKPQALNLLLEAINLLKKYSKAYFLIIGKGSEYDKIRDWLSINKCTNAKLINFLPSEEYNQAILASDVGLILLKDDITVPNIPEKTLSYMANGRPILAATDNATDIGFIIERRAKCGKWVSSKNLDEFIKQIKYMCEHPKERKIMGKNSKDFFNSNWDVSTSVSIINSLFTTKKES